MKYSEEERQILSQEKEMQELLRTPGWKILEEILEGIIKERVNGILEREIDGVNDFINLERLKGSIIALKGILALPKSIISHASLIRSDARKEEEDI